MNISKQKISLHILRLGLASVFLWFGFSQLIDTLSWVDIVPDWAVDLLHIPPAMIVMANGVFEVVLGGLIALGFFVRISAFVLALHLLVISIDFGFTATGVRDFGLAVAAIGLSLIYTKNSEDK